MIVIWFSKWRVEDNLRSGVPVPRRLTQIPVHLLLSFYTIKPYAIIYEAELNGDDWIYSQLEWI